MPDNNVAFAALNELYLDPLNARLGRRNVQRGLSQAQILDLMRDWTLDELAVSFAESGFWTQEALLVVRERVGTKQELVVVEGNRRLAALKYLYKAAAGHPVSKQWAGIAKGLKPSSKLFTHVPYVLVASRKELEAFLGFRHVTGIKEWHPAEKAEFIAKMIEVGNMSYEEVMRKIGSKAPTVRQHYISYRLLLQMESQDEISLQHVEEKFSVLYLSLRTDGVQKYLQIDIEAPPNKARKPVPKARLANLANFALWLFGDDQRPPLVSDSRQVDNFGRILESKKAIEYLERSESPSFEAAFRLAGGDEAEVAKLIERAADSMELALSTAHLYQKSKEVKAAVLRCCRDASQLLTVFPDVEKRLRQEQA